MIVRSDNYRKLRFYPVFIIPPMLHTHFHIHVALTRRTNGRSLGTSQKKQCSFWNRRTLNRKVLSLFFFRLRSPVSSCVLPVDMVVSGQVLLQFVSPQSVYFHQWFLLIFIFMLRLLEGQAGETWKASSKAMIPEIDSTGKYFKFSQNQGPFWVFDAKGAVVCILTATLHCLFFPFYLV